MECIFGYDYSCDECNGIPGSMECFARKMQAESEGEEVYAPADEDDYDDVDEYDETSSDEDYDEDYDEDEDYDAEDYDEDYDDDED